MKVTGAGSSDQGPSRPANEDAFLANDSIGLYIVSDGMGGHQAGQVASRMAIDAVVAAVREGFNAETGSSDSSPKEYYTRLMRKALMAACAEVHRSSIEKPEYRGMGATMTALLVRGNDGYMGHVGDSRLYLHRGGKVYQISHDHTVMQEMIDRGVVTPDQAENSPYQHVLSRALGVYESVQVDTLHFDVLPGDQYLLCTDGLLVGLDDPRQMLPRHFDQSAKQAARELVVSACARNTSDNATAVVVTVEALEDEREEQELRRHEVTLRVQSLKSVYMFRNLQLSELVRVIDISHPTYVRQGESVYKEGDDDRSLYLILIGELEVRQLGKQIAHLKQGNHFGEMALLADRNRAFEVVALRDSKLLQIEEEKFLEFIKRRPVTGVKLLSEISRELGRRLYVSTRVDQKPSQR